MDRTNDITLPAGTSWLNDPDAQSVCRFLAEGGYQALFVGGCVRDAMLGVPSGDVDISTDALPEDVMRLAGVAGLRALPTGIEHGTITVVSGETPFEITTFRRDVATDGRRAVVAFSKDIAEDARRRDFTMNALYASPDGQLIDPLGGVDDLLQRRIRFIEDPHARITEDYLRTLRFFRFFAWYGRESDGFDPAAIAAIAENTDGLETLSAERVGQEMRKLLSAANPGFAMAGMRSTGVLQALLPGADDRWIGPIAHLEQELHLDVSWIRRLAALGGDKVSDRLRLSKAEARALTLSKEAGFGSMPVAEVGYRHGKEIGLTAVLLHAVMAEQPPTQADIQKVITASTARFPLKSADLIADFQGPALGQKLAELEQIWIDSGFALKKSELLNHG